VGLFCRVTYRLLTSAGLLILFSFREAWADSSVFEFSIVSQRADISLVEYAKVTNLDIVFSQNSIKQYTTQELDGFFKANNALARLLEGTPLIATKSNNGGLVVKVDTRKRLRPIASKKAAVPVLEELVVTAQKREEFLADVPIAITRLGSMQIERSFSNSIEELATLVPSASIRKGGTTRNSAVFLRGIGTTTFSVAAEPSVSTVVDGVVLSRSGQAFADLFDVERIEVLRGPQGTLFGKNSSGGVINITTKSPARDNWQTDLNLSVFQGTETRLEAVTSGPLNERAALRLAVLSGEFKGLDTNIFSGKKINGYSRKGIRSILEVEPTDELSLKFIGEYYDSNDNCCAAVIIPSNYNSGQADVDAFIEKGRTTDLNLATQTLDKTAAISMEAAWYGARHSITSISAFRDWRNLEIDDNDFNSEVRDVWVRNTNAVTGAIENSGIGSFQRHANGDQTTTQFSQEFRLTSIDQNIFQYQLGFFYWDVDTDRTFTRSNFLLCDPLVNGDVCDINDLGNLPSFSPEASAVINTNFNSVALFGQGTYDVSERFRTIFGLRWTHDEVGYTHQRMNTSGVGGPGIRAEDHFNTDRQSNSELTGRIGYQYSINDTWMTYGTYVKGYKGPAYNVTFSMNPSRRRPVAPETADSFEFGMKGTLADGRLFASFAAYNVEYVGFQASNFILVNGVTSSNLSNVGNVTTKGIEFDFIAKVSQNLNVNGGFAIGSARFTEFDCGSNCASDNGRVLAFAPDIKSSVSIDYSHAFVNRPVKLHLNSQINYQSAQYTNLGERDSNFVAARFLWDASIGISNKSDTTRLSLILKNITDHAYVSEVRSEAQALVGIVPRNAQRYFGLNLDIKF
jgi:iron complex outermembrane receptor protein